MTDSELIRTPDEYIEMSYGDEQMDGAGHARVTTSDQIAAVCALGVLGALGTGGYFIWRGIKNCRSGQGGGNVRQEQEWSQMIDHRPNNPKQPTKESYNGTDGIPFEIMGDYFRGERNIYTIDEQGNKKYFR